MEAHKSLWLQTGIEDYWKTLEATGIFNLQPQLHQLCHNWKRRIKQDSKCKIIQCKKGTNLHMPILKIEKSVNSAKSEIGGNIYGLDYNL